MQPIEKYTKHDNYLFFLVEGLTRYLLPEIISLIHYYTFAPYQLTGILHVIGDKGIKPITLSCYSLLPAELFNTYYSLVMPTLGMTLKRETWGLSIRMDVPTKPTPLACQWDSIEKTPLHHILRRMIEEANGYLQVCRVRLTLKY